MPFADASVITAFKRDPVKFLEGNLVVCTYAGSTTLNLDKFETTQAYLVDEGIKTLALEVYPSNLVVARKLGDDLPAYRIMPASAVGATGGATFTSYICPYNQSYSFGITIADKADFMVTPQMDGCTFGVGSPTSSGARLVYHANCGGNKALQASRIQTVLPGAKLWEKDQYMQERLNGYYGFRQFLKTTLIGVRNNTSGRWNFYSQVYEWVAKADPVTGVFLPTKVFLRDVREFKTD